MEQTRASVDTLEGIKGNSVVAPMEQVPSGLSILVISNDLDKVLAALVIANGAAAMDMPVTMFFAFWGITVLRKSEPLRTEKGLVEGMFSLMMPRGPGPLKLSRLNMGGLGTLMMKRVMKKKNVYGPEQLLDMALQNGVKLIACTMSMDMMGIRPEEIREGVSRGGVAKFLESADEAKIHLIFGN